MSQVSWIKFSTATFEDEKIRLIEGMPAGDSLLVVWQKMLCQAGKTNDRGYIYLVEGVPYTPAMLSTAFRKDITIINTALDIFQKFQMIEIDQKGIRIVNWEKHQSVDRMERIKEQDRERKRRQRERQKSLPPPPTPPPEEKPPQEDGGGSHGVSRDIHGTCHDEVTPSHATDIETELELENIDDGDAGTRNTTTDDVLLEPDQDFVEASEHARSKLGVHFLSANDIQCIQELLLAGVARGTIIEGIDFCFERYKPKNKFDKINSITYCKSQIIKLHESKLQAARAQAELGTGYAQQAPAAEIPETLLDPNYKPEEDEELQRLLDQTKS